MNISAPLPDTSLIDLERRRADKLSGLRLLLPKLEHLHQDAGVLPFGLAAIDRKLPGGGLALDGLHEIAPQSLFDSACALAFLASRLAALQHKGMLWLVVSPRGLAGLGMPHGHGLRALGLDPGGLILVMTADETEAAWALEEILRSGVTGAVAGLVGGGFDLAMSRRLQLAAATAPCPLFLLHPPHAKPSNTAITRWRIAAAPGAQDRFGLFCAWRWQVQLERSRNGQTGLWLMEFDHVTHRLDLAAALADSALPDVPAREAQVA